jgi:citronellol/citronellal dehydrogenase
MFLTDATQVTDLGSEGVPFKCDVRNDVEIEKMVEETMKRFGRIDILINNAGALWWKKVVDTDMKRYDLINSINSREPGLPYYLLLKGLLLLAPKLVCLTC